MLSIRLFFVFSSMSYVISLSSQEDLSIRKYTHLACLKFQSNREFLVHNLQENFLLPYQTFSSSSMTIELCFRLCRRWFILLSSNQNNCLCLYTIHKRYELEQHLGEVLAKENCTSNDVQIYALTNDIQILPSLSISPSDDWSFDGCYYQHGIQTIRANLILTHMNYIQAIDQCRKHCRTYRQTNYYSYYLSQRKSCYCLPINYSQINQTIALRKPLRHCAFHPYICQGFSSPCENDYLNTSLDTLIKIDVQHYCLTTEFITFVFDSMLFRCFNSISLQLQMNFTMINDNQKCLPLLIQTAEQWKYLIASSWVTYSKLFISIDRNSTYIFNELLRYSNLTLLSLDLCMAIYRTEANKTNYELLPCKDVRLPGYVLCTQKPFPSVISSDDDFQTNRNDETDVNFSCPSGFVLFDKICYYIDLSFVDDLQNGERLCSNQNSKSTLVKFDSHEWGNLNPTKFLGRKYEDILLEFFYYLLEKKLSEQTIDESNRKHWLRLLLGDKNDPNECLLRYFIRSSGAFTTVYQCVDGGHPVCQTKPIRTSNPSLRATTLISSVNNRSRLPIVTTSICENCTSTPLADEDLVDNQTRSAVPLSHKKYINYRPLLVILSGPGIALLILLFGVALLIRHLRKNQPSYSRRSSAVDSHRLKRSSTILTASDYPDADIPSVLYARIQPRKVSLMEDETLLPFDRSPPVNSETIELLPPNQIRVSNEEEILYSTLN